MQFVLDALQAVATAAASPFALVACLGAVAASILIGSKLRRRKAVTGGRQNDILAGFVIGCGVALVIFALAATQRSSQPPAVDQSPPIVNVSQPEPEHVAGVRVIRNGVRREFAERHIGPASRVTTGHLFDMHEYLFPEYFLRLVYDKRPARL